MEKEEKKGEQDKFKESKNELLKTDQTSKNNIFYTLEKIQNNVFHIQSQNQLSESIVNYFTMAVGLFMFGCIHADIIYKKEIEFFIYGNIAIAGVAQIGLGIYDWYKGKSITLLSNVLFGFLFVSWFLKYYMNDEQENDGNENGEKGEGILYIIWSLLSIILIVAVKNKGLIYTLNYLAVTVGFVFVFIDKYADQNWTEKTSGYIFIVSGAFFWLTGLLRFINKTFMNNTLQFLKE